MSTSSSYSVKNSVAAAGICDDNDAARPLMLDNVTSSYSVETVKNSVMAGYAAGICGVLIGHPMDSAKVWLQTKGMNNTTPSTTTATSLPSSSSNPTSAAVKNAPSSITRPHANNMSTLAVGTQPSTRGFNLKSIRALYSGVSGPLATIGLIQSINFAIYDSMRRILYQRSGNYDENVSTSDYLYNDSLVNVTASAMVAGGVLSLFTSPLLVVKTKQQIMEWSFQCALHDSLRVPRVSSFYIGFGPHFIAETCGRGIYFCTYESLKRTLFKHKQPHETVSLQERCLSAAVAGIVCWSIIFPCDALRSRMYAQALSTCPPKSSWEMAKSMYQQSNKSMRPFYRGFGVTVLRAGPVAAAVLPVYDMTLEWLSRRDNR